MGPVTWLMECEPDIFHMRKDPADIRVRPIRIAPESPAVVVERPCRAV